jgi:hypothetical protein
MSTVDEQRVDAAKMAKTSKQKGRQSRQITWSAISEYTTSFEMAVELAITPRVQALEQKESGSTLDYVRLGLRLTSHPVRRRNYPGEFWPHSLTQCQPKQEEHAFNLDEEAGVS